MSATVGFHRWAARELNEAAAYYNSEAAGLGGAFLTEIQRCIQAICDRQEAAPILAGPVRRRLARRFPDAVLYSIKPAEIRVLAIMHLKRRPLYWMERE